jgi:hypothetical protein
MNAPKSVDWRCEASNDWILECSHTDAGDPWCVVYDERHQRIVLSISRVSSAG